MRISLQYKLLAAFMALVILVLAGVGVGGSVLIRDYFLASKQHELTDKAYEMARMVNAYYDGHITHGQLHSFVNSVDNFLDARVWVVDKNLELITVSAERANQGVGHGRPATVIKPSPMAPAAWDCNMHGHQGGMMAPRAAEQLDGEPTNKQRRRQVPQSNITEDKQSVPQGPAHKRKANRPDRVNHGPRGERYSGKQTMMGGGMGGRRSGLPANQPPSRSMAGLMPSSGSQEQLQVKQQLAGEQVAPPPVVLDLGKAPETGIMPSSPISLTDITGMADIIQAIQTSYGQAWSKTYYHPYYEENMLVVAAPLQRSDGSIGGTVMINAPLTEFDGFLQHVYTYLGYAALAAILLAALLAAYVASGIVQPLKAMRETAAAMAQGDYGQRVTVAAHDEVGDLGNSINSLAQDLGEYVRQMEMADHMRRDLVANVSHELRTPLTIMYGYNQALQDGTVTDPEKVKKYHHVMGDEILRLEKLIADLLDLSQLQASATIQEAEEVLLAEVIDNVMMLLKQRSEERGVMLAPSIDADILPIQGDGDRLTQLVLILMDNALKFTPPGGRVNVRLSQENDSTILSIADTGAGIAPQDLPHVWERFYKVDKSRASSGTGLGLAIARQIIELHGATVDVTSACGEGTTFTIHF